MATESNKLLVQRFIAEVWNAGNLDAADELVHEDYSIPGIGKGPAAVKHNASVYRKAFPDLEWRIDQMIAEGDWVAIRVMQIGTHLGMFAGIPPTGKRVEMQELVFLKIVDGKLHTIVS